MILGGCVCPGVWTKRGGLSVRGVALALKRD
jgi:hypothetical protein